MAIDLIFLQLNLIFISQQLRLLVALGMIGAIKDGFYL
jgi:hypothetical protein